MILGNLLKFVRLTLLGSSDRFPQNFYLQRSHFTYFALRAVFACWCRCCCLSSMLENNKRSIYYCLGYNGNVLRGKISRKKKKNKDKTM